MKHFWRQVRVAQVPKSLLVAMFVAFVILVARVVSTESPVMASDEYAYFMGAKYAAQGQELYRYDPAMQPIDNKLYRVLFDAWTLVSVERVALVGRLFNVLVFVVASLLVFVLGNRVFDRRTATISSILYLLLPFSFYSTLLLPEVEFQALVYAGVALALWAAARRSPWAVLLPALVSAAAYFAKPHAAALVVGIAAFFMVSDLLARVDGRWAALKSGVVRGALYLLSTGAVVYLVRRLAGDADGGGGGMVSSFYAYYLQRLSSPAYLLGNAWSMLDYVVGHAWVLMLMFAPGCLVIAGECWRVARSLATGRSEAPLADDALQRRRFAVLVALLGIAFLAMIGAFTNAASQVSEFEKYRLHGRYLEPLLPLLLLFSVWGVYASRRLKVMSAALLVSVLMFCLYLRFQYRLYPWDYPDIFVFFTSGLKHWSLPGVNNWLMWLVVLAAVAFFICALRNRFAARAYLVYLVLLMLGSHVQMANWLRQSARDNRAMIEAGDMLGECLVGAPPGTGLVLVDDRYGRSSFFLMQFANLQHVRSIGKAADFAGELPPGVSWIIAPSDVHVEREALARFEFGPQSLYRFDQAGACQ
ncbi:MAG: hypothetical protein ABS96_28680 [Lysobacteraceae bacterium SCN 69-123]|jgi:hypothetical protein|uniref:glycosyltransferase family 39 protein n=1 Tax=Stenotrophomonas acidaminiphila TaxID=128780 RepID=UPI00086F884B|nr:glycosyltransferase family 39 protein [Stenotrophomonas acidaminiphila]MBN8801117.1 glycosyltransferase family 39 protein [Stenotrophomonas acidaminiphila]MDF9441737.1 hypothetical protein [Stenotrophomonas acidaminiphila]ODU42265.1 MAG: hypothetical protein ABS96_28680 [Xanthomonadaceae bacterium SCN 69-123]OJY78792.1 MAG: hypothetical protein BGP18_10555 [Stenotrophomonas sp. 69-14]